ncbi:hypothetical protein SA19142_12230 [Staphylococcus argenteus]|uniref:type II toxin-antitoxin system antitoxin TsaA n=1 Tax=Staphylococcus argenteus TaxID=985002 RepID=UPI001FB892CD|nr:hypothetical protein [Staphylococcus argenteus]MCG9795969.1 hypothetical protein [Staphylococcus argenteus]MCG9804747.1 hypothetical protein [Staphylococcus argenteus]MCG9830599.1 hypothetical protein [Staphylococcus argenteus]GJF70023.1 hypothetical protein SA19142_12230 [Staphylococcus argenteus]
MKNIQLNAINLVITIIFAIFNIMITYNKDLDDLCWLLPGIIICGSILIVSFTIAMITKFWLSEILFFINIVLVLYYIYPIFL